MFHTTSNEHAYDRCTLGDRTKATVFRFYLRITSYFDAFRIL